MKVLPEKELNRKNIADALAFNLLNSGFKITYSFPEDSTVDIRGDGVALFSNSHQTEYVKRTPLLKRIWNRIKAIFLPIPKFRKESLQKYTVGIDYGKDNGSSILIIDK
jgi:hypothetical protein